MRRRRFGLPGVSNLLRATLFNTGFRDLARAQARRTLAVLEESRGPVIVPSGSCASMIRHGYLELLRDEPEPLGGIPGWPGRSKIPEPFDKLRGGSAEGAPSSCWPPLPGGCRGSSGKDRGVLGVELEVVKRDL